jgi:hypothetical protein
LEPERREEGRIGGAHGAARLQRATAGWIANPDGLIPIGGSRTATFAPSANAQSQQLFNRPRKFRVKSAFNAEMAGAGWNRTAGLRLMALVLGAIGWRGVPPPCQTKR